MKKLKGLGNRAYNVMFHTHTVAGIVISFGLFIIFYAGAYTLFFHELKQWENPDYRQPVVEDVDFDMIVDQVDKDYQLDHTSRVNVYFPNEHEPIVKVFGQGATSDTTTEFVAIHYDIQEKKFYKSEEDKSTVGSTIYGLHYFRQIPTVGLYIAGFVALFFLFASITGILVHWRNLLTKFYSFVREGKWKQIWTNAHTVLGVISFPFQVMYAVTGAFFGLLILILIPVVFLQYDGDVNKVYGKIIPFYGYEVDEDALKSENYSFVDLYQQVRATYPGYKFYRAQLLNYGKEDAKILFAIDNMKGLHSGGSIVMGMKDGKIVDELSTLPNERKFGYGAADYITKLHFGVFGGFFIKVIYFVLSMITCFMIISGVLLWREARNNNRYTFKQKLFHHRVTKWYLAICLGLFPALAILFLANKLVPWEMEGRTDLVNQIFFLGWLGLLVVGLFWDKYALQNKNYLMIGGFLSLLVPVANGVMTGDWMWSTWDTYPWVAYVDIFWLITGLTALYLVFFVLKVKEDSDKPEPPIEETQVVEEKISTPRLKLPELTPQLVKFMKMIRG